MGCSHASRKMPQPNPDGTERREQWEKLAGRDLGRRGVQADQMFLTSRPALVRRLTADATPEKNSTSNPPIVSRRSSRRSEKRSSSPVQVPRSEERRGGEEGRSRGGPYH